MAWLMRWNIIAWFDLSFRRAKRGEICAITSKRFLALARNDKVLGCYFLESNHFELVYSLFHGKILPAMLEKNDDLTDLDSSQVTNISQSDVVNVHGDSVRMHQSDADTVTAENVALEKSAAANVKAGKVSANNSGMAYVEAEEVLMQESGVGFAQAGKMSLSGYTGAVVAGSAEVHNAMAGFVAGRDVQVNESRTGILLARTVHGDVNTVLDTRGALIAGLTAGLFSGLMLLLGRVLFRRK
jgi:hypothetical protein